MPNMPRLLTVKTPPSSSFAFSLPRPARSGRAFGPRCRRQAQGCRLMHDRREQAGVGVHRESDMDFARHAQMIVRPLCGQQRMLLQRHGDQLDEAIGDGRLGCLRSSTRRVTSAWLSALPGPPPWLSGVVRRLPGGCPTMRPPMSCRPLPARPWRECDRRVHCRVTSPNQRRARRQPGAWGEANAVWEGEAPAEPEVAASGSDFAAVKFGSA